MAKPGRHWVEIARAGRSLPSAAPFGLAFALASAWAGSAAPAAETRARLIPDWKQSHLEEGDQAVQATYRLAACARVKRREAVEAVFDTVPGSAEERSRILAAVMPGEEDCPIRVKRLVIRNFVLMRGALAEALYNGDRVKPHAAPMPLAEAVPATGRGTSLTVARWVVRCAVSRNPTLVHQVLKFNPGGIGEGRTLRMLKPTFTECLPAGRRLSVSRLNVRALIAQELYRASRTFKESFANAQG